MTITAHVMLQHEHRRVAYDLGKWVDIGDRLCNNII